MFLGMASRAQRLTGIKWVLPRQTPYLIVLMVNVKSTAFSNSAPHTTIPVTLDNSRSILKPLVVSVFSSQGVSAKASSSSFSVFSFSIFNLSLKTSS